MPTPLKGSARLRRGKWSARVSLGKKKPRLSIPMTTCAADDTAKAADRAELLATSARRLTAAGTPDAKIEEWLTRIGGRDGKALENILLAIDRLAAGEAQAPISAATTFREFGTQWTDGTLHERWPDHVKKKETAGTDAQRLARHVYPHVGDVALPAFMLNHAELVMSQLPPDLSSSSRRHVAQVIARLLKLAAYPARIIEKTPLPAGFLPSVGQRKAMTFLYPDEDRALLGCTEVPLASRILYGFLTREGMRKSEAAALTWNALDLERGAVRLDENKTDDPRAWALDPGVVRALAALARLRRADEDERVFVDENGASVAARPDFKECARLRDDLRAAGVERSELYERTAVRQPLRMHDLRATFVTISLANGRSETWVADRTGHASSAMINRYRRAARTVTELGLGELEPLDRAIPELRSPEPTAPAPRPEESGVEPDPTHDVAPSVEPVGSDPSLHVSSTSDFLIVDDGLRELFSRMGHGGLEPPANGLRVRPNRSVGNLSVAFRGIATVRSLPFATAGATSGAHGATSRGELARALGGAAGALADAGDVHAARIAHEALGRLLDAPAAPGEARAEVIDLAGRRKP